MSIYEEIQRGREAFLSYGKARQKKYPEIWKRIEPPKIPYGQDYNNFDRCLYDVNQEINTYNNRFFIIRLLQRFIYPRTIKEKHAYVGYLRGLLIYQDLYLDIKPDANNLTNLKTIYSTLNIWQSVYWLTRKLVYFCSNAPHSPEQQQKKAKDLSMFIDVSQFEQSQDENVKKFREEVKDLISQLNNQLSTTTEDNVNELVRKIKDHELIIENSKKNLLETINALNELASRGPRFVDRFINFTQKVITYLRARDRQIDDIAKAYVGKAKEELSDLFISWINKELDQFREKNIPSLNEYDPTQDMLTPLLARLESFIAEQFLKYETQYTSYLNQRFYNYKASIFEAVKKRIEARFKELHQEKGEQLSADMVRQIRALGSEFSEKMEAVQAVNFPELKAENTRISMAFWNAAGQIYHQLQDIYRIHFDREMQCKLHDDYLSVEPAYETNIDNIYYGKITEIETYGQTLPKSNTEEVLSKVKKNYENWCSFPEDNKDNSVLNVSIGNPSFNQFNSITTISSLGKILSVYQTDLMKLQSDFSLVVHILNFYSGQVLPINLMPELVDNYTSHVKKMCKSLIIKYSTDKVKASLRSNSTNNVEVEMAEEVKDFLNGRTTPLKEIDDAIKGSLILSFVSKNLSSNAEPCTIDFTMTLLRDCIKDITKRLKDEKSKDEANNSNIPVFSS